MDGRHVQKSPHDLDVRPKHDYRTLCNAQQVIECNDATGVAIHDNGDIYVGSWDHCIDVFDQTGQLKNTIGTEGSGDGQFSHPSGIPIKGDVLYVADSGNNHIQKPTSRGQFNHKFGHEGSGQGEFDGPRTVIVDSYNRLIVTDSDNHRIQIFNEDNGWLLTIDGKDTVNSSFKCPVGVALDPQGNIHVAYIKVFTNEGMYVRTYGDPGAPRPWYIAIDDEGNALVSYGKSLSIFDRHGNKMHEVGNLEDSRCIALDPRDGSVYVADNGANSVLKYSTTCI